MTAPRGIALRAAVVVAALALLPSAASAQMVIGGNTTSYVGSFRVAPDPEAKGKMLAILLSKPGSAPVILRWRCEDKQLVAELEGGAPFGGLGDDGRLPVTARFGGREVAQRWSVRADMWLVRMRGDDARAFAREMIAADTLTLAYAEAAKKSPGTGLESPGPQARGAEVAAVFALDGATEAFEQLLPCGKLRKIDDLEEGR